MSIQCIDSLIQSIQCVLFNVCVRIIQQPWFNHSLFLVLHSLIFHSIDSIHSILLILMMEMIRLTGDSSIHWRIQSIYRKYHSSFIHSYSDGRYLPCPMIRWFIRWWPCITLHCSVIHSHFVPFYYLPTPTYHWSYDHSFILFFIPDWIFNETIRKKKKCIDRRKLSDQYVWNETVWRYDNVCDMSNENIILLLCVNDILYY